MTIVTAKEARRLTEHSKQMQERMDTINAAVNAAAVMGNYNCIAKVEEELSQEDIAAISSVLTEMGFTVGSVIPVTIKQEGDMRGVKGVSFDISWKEDK